MHFLFAVISSIVTIISLLYFRPKLNKAMFNENLNLLKAFSYFYQNRIVFWSIIMF